MSYKELYRENNENIKERYEIVSERIRTISNMKEAELSIEEKYASFFVKISKYLVKLQDVLEMEKEGKLLSLSLEDGEKLNKSLFNEITKENYESSFANPTFAVKKLGKDFGQMFSAIYASVIRCIPSVFQGDYTFLCIYQELILEIYTTMQDEEGFTYKAIKDSYYWFKHDYIEVVMEDRVNKLIDPEYDYYRTLIDSAKDGIDYLYRYGFFISNDEIESAKYLETFSDEEIQKMANTYTEGYRIGFEVTGKDLTIKDKVEIRYPIGFERMVAAAISNFEKLNLKPILKPFSTSANKQFDYDHREDAGLILDKAIVERGLESYRCAFEKKKTQARGYAGPAVIEVFGEEPFSPITKEENVKLSDKQQKLSVYNKSESSQIVNKYIVGEERSFTIIAYPIPSIGEKYKEIFAETVKLNTLDYNFYKDMQQKIIDVLDTGDKAHIVGKNGNKTDLYVNLYKLNDPTKETIFENCVADVNIPVGEVFTSPVLKETTGKLHVSQVYLNGLNFINLEIDFKDGMIENYTCTNFESEEDNKKYIKDNILMNHETLPMGEFAIGTNTVAYKMADTYKIADKMPILIAEKTGPHFAVGDTCYSYDEDNMTYNPDKKAIVARDNEISILRKEDYSKAYFNCHTDITIPYNELGRISVITKSGESKDIIVDGRFVVPGTLKLNEPLDEMDRMTE
ncbi:aminopeptidase [Lachnobacterium bovis]|uniref:Thermophilic metalloprotease (M29) n=1 Tax=Lachnobacterium bovis TaxID=140626 RepID=A0A1H9T375_9FIRM|nr:aminopeptidase [Lachnobacterium bovis]SER91581.1 Thermophilic metalloprotease (M29) [Lachnobacterium bovis]